ncbi:MAG: ATP-binding protein, partial [Stackebrandtia sp.]
MAAAGVARGVALVGAEGRVTALEARVDDQSRQTDHVDDDWRWRQARIRLRAAFDNSGLPWPAGSVSFEVRPASLPYGGVMSDLTVAAAVLSAAGCVPVEAAQATVFVGELGLDGRLRPVRGVLPAVLAAKDSGAERVVVPAANLAETSQAHGVTVLGAASLSEVVEFLRGDRHLPGPGSPQASSHPLYAAWSDLLIEHPACRAVEVAAAGGHHLFLLGSPGAGTAFLAERLVELLPDLSEEAWLEVSCLQSLAEILPAEALPSRRPPFSAPHFSSTLAAMRGAGGRGAVRPGAVSLAHRGVLFVDDAPEFRRDVLDALRQPLEHGELSIMHQRVLTRLPAYIQLVAAARPCPCGARRREECACTRAQATRYLGRLAGPLMDRIDIRVDLDRPDASPQPATPAASFADIAYRVAAAREAAALRWG